MEVKNVDVKKLVEHLLDQKWHKECEIIKEDNKILVKYPNEHQDVFLRYSKGPKQGFTWDIYGDDLQKTELAIIALSNAPVPLNYRKAEYPLVFKMKVK